MKARMNTTQKRIIKRTEMESLRMIEQQHGREAGYIIEIIIASTFLIIRLSFLSRLLFGYY
jgi:hypothetical protein